MRSRGTDTVPAMLTPGEFVVNADATAANLGLLHAINSGYKFGPASAPAAPAAPAAMGGFAAPSVGDTNVTVLIGGEAIDPRLVTIVRKEIASADSQSKYTRTGRA